MTNNELIQCFYDSVNISERILKSETEKAIHTLLYNLDKQLGSGAE